MDLSSVDTSRGTDTYFIENDNLEPLLPAGPRERRRSVLIFGDSFVLDAGCWPECWAHGSYWQVRSYAEGGCTSASLPGQVATFARNVERHPLLPDPVAIIHIGGNDLQMVLFDPAMGPKRTICSLLLAALQVLLWCLAVLVTFSCCFVKRFAAGDLLLRCWMPIARCTGGPEYSLTSELSFQRIEEAVQYLYSQHQVRHVVIAGLPVTPGLPFMAEVFKYYFGKPGRKATAARRCLARCLHGTAARCLSLWCGCGRDLHRSFCALVEKRHPGCHVLFFDEAGALERLIQSGQAELTSGFWEDPLHPTMHGHSLLALEFAQVWASWPASQL